ncbi:MAG: helix-turn-helix transcriptional regulator [Oscillospiraceae bacterium]|nr:helix-turn-helix transcriptional regulator [Oscillospiraceae bacterium]
MAIGERIHFFRNLRGMTQKYLGSVVGFSEKTADVRMAQYEAGTRTPKSDLTSALAQALDVSPQALDVPDIDSQVGLMHTLFALEDIYGITIGEIDGEVCLKVDKDKGRTAYDLLEMLTAWKEQSDKLNAGEIDKEEYDKWRYNYPKFDTTKRWVKIPSQELSDALVEQFKKQK